MIPEEMLLDNGDNSKLISPSVKCDKTVDGNEKLPEMPVVNPKPISECNDIVIRHKEESGHAVKVEMPEVVDEGTSAQPCFLPNYKAVDGHEEFWEMAVVNPDLSSAWRDSGMFRLNEPDYALKVEVQEVVDDGSSLQPWLLPNHLAMDGNEELLGMPAVNPELPTAWEDANMIHLNEPGYAIKVEMPEAVDEGTSAQPCFLPNHKDGNEEFLEMPVVNPELPSAWKDSSMLHLNELAYAIKVEVPEVVNEGTSLQPCFPLNDKTVGGNEELQDMPFLNLKLPSAWEGTGTLHLNEPAYVIKVEVPEVVDEENSVQPCFMPNHETVGGNGELLEIPVMNHKLPSPREDTNVLHLNESAYAMKVEVPKLADEETSVQPCLLPNQRTLDGNEVLLEMPDVHSKLPSAGQDADIIHLNEPSHAIKVEVHDVLEEETGEQPCFLPNHSIPPNFVQKEQMCTSCKLPRLGDTKDKYLRHREATSDLYKEVVTNDVNQIKEEPDGDNAFKDTLQQGGSSKKRGRPRKNLSKVQGGSPKKRGRPRKDPSKAQKGACVAGKLQEIRGQKEVFRDNSDDGQERVVEPKLGDTQDEHLSYCETTSDIYKEVTNDVNQIKEEPDAEVAFKDNIQQGFSSKKRGRPRKDPSKARKSACVVGKSHETSGQEEVVRDNSDDEQERVVEPDPAGRNRCNNSLKNSDARRRVRDTLRLFHGVLKKLVQAQEKKKMGRVDASLQLHAALKIFKDHGMYINTKKMMGPVPGVEVGDLFNYRVELDIIGLHKPIQSGIDFIKLDNKYVAISVVASGRYDNDVVNSDVLIYTGQGGNVAGGCKQLEDQKLERGNLALKNSIDKKNMVRVIRGFKERKMTAGVRTTIPSYVYDGLYFVERYWQESGTHGMMIYKFELRRVPHQPELIRKEVKQSMQTRKRKGRRGDDIMKDKDTPTSTEISKGEETSIFAVNTIDDEKSPSFTYITKVIYPDWCRPLPPKGCDCKDGCLDSKHCACSLKNGGEIPYNYSGVIVEEKPLVYECGPSCKCPPTCHNRVSQHGIKLPLEVFKTESKGWGVRCLSSISSGTFVCEYIGKLLDDKEAEERIDNDEYLFDIGQNYNDLTLRDGLSALMPDMPSSHSDVVDNVGFTLDAEKYGNVGRFINHSCSPNLVAQNVLYDHEDKRIPHIMFFAAENIPPLQELTYHYNYKIDQVFDSEGNIKKKTCYCGSSECSGRMY